MISLHPQNILLQAVAQNKQDAIRQAGRMLVDGGYITSGYVESMLHRESQADTYLGKGIAIPHGLGKDRNLIHKTGVAVVQFPAGVVWNPGQMVHIVVAIAAKSSEHLGILAALTDVLDDTAMAHRLAKTKDSADIIDGLTRREENAPPQQTESLAGAVHIDVKITGNAGLHARPATVFVSVAKEFESEVRVQYGSKIANGKAMASLLKLGVEGGATIRILTSGPDAGEALKALKAAVESGLDEEEETSESPADTRIWTPESNGRTILGVAAAPGLSIGRLFQFRATEIVVNDTPGESIEADQQDFQKALKTACEQLSQIQDAVLKRGGKTEAAIFRAQQALLEDEDLGNEVMNTIQAGHGAAWAWQHAIEQRIKDLQQLDNERLAERAADFHDIGQRTLHLILGSDHSEIHLPDEPVILVAEDLSPSDTARLDPKRILGICTASGGPTSHTAIIARSLDIPAVVGAGSAVTEATDGIICVLDGSAGKLYVEPNTADLQSARSFQISLHIQRDKEFGSRFEPALLTDGHRVEIVANIGRVVEASQAVEAGAEGIGLLRTEFFFLERTRPPSEEEQFKAYSAMARALNGLPLIIRTLDIGGDKVVPYLPQPNEENPFLGVRGIRLCLQKPELFLPQLRAIYRASVVGPVKIMFPMIATLEELRAAKELAEQVRAELDVPPIEIGIMVEVPSTVAMAAEFAKECDFFSIGTNDLTQYVLAMDRMHPALARQVDGLHPAVLRMIDQTVRAADAAGKWVGVCGGIAGDPRGAAILTGLGITELSMSIPSIASLKAYLRKISKAQAQKLARQALACTTASEVHALPLPA